MALGAFHWNEAAANRLLKAASGPVGKDLARRAVAVESRMKLNASGRPGPNVDTGRLRSSITWTLGEDSKGPYADIGSNVEYAIYLELGTVNMPGGYPFMARALDAAK